jgi:hypothetical protein
MAENELSAPPIPHHYDVFISYRSSSDKEIAMLLYDEITGTHGLTGDENQSF